MVLVGWRPCSLLCLQPVGHVTRDFLYHQWVTARKQHGHLASDLCMVMPGSATGTWLKGDTRVIGTSEHELSFASARSTV
jgi:hypothetical protein